MDSIKWLTSDVRENENAIEDPRARKHRLADHCNLNVHDDWGVYHFEIYFNHELCTSRLLVERFSAKIREEPLTEMGKYVKSSLKLLDNLGLSAIKIKTLKFVPRILMIFRISPTNAVSHWVSCCIAVRVENP
jgi:hypothetical protein